MHIVFPKTGKEVKSAIQHRLSELHQRLEHRNAALDEFLKDTAKVRSFLIRSAESMGGHRPSTLYSSKDISSEERQEVAQLCRRIFEIEQEIIRLNLITLHLSDEDTFELDFNDLAAYGFDSIESE
jgi:hypothetical protein